MSTLDLSKFKLNDGSINMLNQGWATLLASRDVLGIRGPVHVLLDSKMRINRVKNIILRSFYDRTVEIFMFFCHGFSVK